jgi:hypothetical protein
MKRQYYELMSLKAIRKIFREEKLIRIKRKKPKTKQNLREVTSGLQFTAYANEKSLALANLFMQILLRHLERCGIKLEGCIIQTDNGSEFIGAWNKKGQTAFTATIEIDFKMIHQTIPCSAHTWQADVETAHRLIEDEFFEVESFKDRKDFLEKVGSYLLWFNTARKNSYKENQTPWEIIKAKCPHVSPQIVNLPPFYLDELFAAMPDESAVKGHDLIPHSSPHGKNEIAPPEPLPWPPPSWDCCAHFNAAHNKKVDATPHFA